MSNARKTLEPAAAGAQLLFDKHALQGMIFIDGRYRAPSGGTLEVLEKATGQALFVAGQASAEDIGEAVIAAGAAQRRWAAIPGPQRGDILQRFADLLLYHGEEVKEWVIRETGAFSGKGNFEVELSAREAREASTLASRPGGEALASSSGSKSWFERVPVGIVGIITPWNSPLILAVRSLIPALALGNAVILKPDPQTPVSGGLLIAELLKRAGLPDGLFHVVPGGGDLGAALVEHPSVNAIAFTGSTQVGKKIGAVAGGMLKRVSLELGGKNAFIVCDDADIDRAAMAGAFGTFFHQGQICFTIGRHLVHEAIYERYVSRLVEHARRLRVGDPFRSDVHLGPMINETQARRAQDLLDRSVAMGATVLCGGTRTGLFFQPAVVEVRPGMPLFEEEIFGPIAAIVVVRDDEQAISLANDTPYGLVAAIQTSSEARGEAIAARLETGIVHINDQSVVHEVYGPIGGVKASGNGARTGLPAWEHEFTQMKWLTRRSVSPDYPF